LTKANIENIFTKGDDADVCVTKGQLQGAEE